MFNSRLIGNYISYLRKKMKLTQSQLAEELGVSHQAVSNWERGESMPDISLLQGLARILCTTADKILASGDSELHKPEHEETREKKTSIELSGLNELNGLKSNNVINTSIDITEYKSKKDDQHEHVPIPDNDGNWQNDYLRKDAVSLPQEEVKETSSTDKIKERYSVEKIAALAPYLSKETLDKIVMTLTTNLGNKFQVKTLNKLLPYLGEESLELIVERLSDNSDWDGIVKLAPYLNEERLELIALELRDDVNWKDLVRLAPFLSEKTLDMVAERIDVKIDSASICSLAPFLSDRSLDRLASLLDIKSDLSTIRTLAPFLSEKALKRMIEQLDGTVDFQNIITLAPFLDEGTLDKLALQSLTDIRL